MRRAAIPILIVLVVLPSCSKRKAPPLSGTATRRVPVTSPQPPRRTSTPAKRPARPVQRPEQAAAAAVTPPVLEALSTPQERAEQLRLIEASLDRARANVAALKARGSAATQGNEIGRLDSFVRQAESARSSQQLGTALDFARRAEVLSSDLLRR
ncbi:MAG TPA: hypothetical protein VES20_07405 [Bryobacteraceae bacterium]|nr:hypothetical protein [Bryobacteraceae bacterium]